MKKIHTLWFCAFLLTWGGCANQQTSQKMEEEEPSSQVITEMEEDTAALQTVSEKDDIWFHVKDIPGSHVILVTNGEEPSDADYTEAASIAAGYSKATADLVAVDYTRVKNIKKPSGSKPGFVVYETNYSAYVTADEETVQKLLVSK